MSERNKVIGHWTCDRGGKADVTQTKKQGHHFNTRCDCCGFVQGTGAARQQAIWENADFIAGEVVVKPSNVEDKPKEGEKQAVEVIEKSEPEPKVPTDFNPTETEPETESLPAERSFSSGKLAAGVAFILAAGAGLWMS